MQVIGIKYIINTFWINFAWLQLCSAKNCEKFVKDFLLANITNEIFPALELKFQLPTEKRTRTQFYEFLRKFCNNFITTLLQICDNFVATLSQSLWELRVCKPFFSARGKFNEISSGGKSEFRNLCFIVNNFFGLFWLFAKKLLLYKTIT